VESDVGQSLEKVIGASPRAAGSGRLLPWVGLTGIVLAAAAAAIWQWGLPVPAVRPVAPAAKTAVPVTVAAVTTQDVPVWLSGIGSVTPLNAVDVKVRVDGQLQRILFTEGQEVTAGQLLAKIDPRSYQATLAQADANRRRDLAQFVSARQEVERATKLASAGAGTSQSLDTVRAQAAALQATLDADQANIDAAKLNLDFTDVTSPLAGRVGMRNADPGAIVHASDAAGLVTVTQIVPIAVLFSLPQDDLPAVMEAQRHDELAVAVDTRDGTRHIADGKLVFINNTVDQTTGQIQMKAVFTNTDRVLWPGQFVSVRLLLRTDRNAAVVPAQAVQTGQNGLYVYVVKSDDTIVAQDVKTGATIKGYIEITDGLTPGQTVVLSGQSRIAPGRLVKPSPVPGGSAS
jgi:membrane fusion protein, multidrug efflux system